MTTPQENQSQARQKQCKITPRSKQGQEHVDLQQALQHQLLLPGTSADCAAVCPCQGYLQGRQDMQEIIKNLNHAVAGLVLSKINPPTCLLGIEIVQLLAQNSFRRNSRS